MKPTSEDPGVYVQEIPSGAAPVAPAPTSVAALIGVAGGGPIHEAVPVGSLAEFEASFGPRSTASTLGAGVRAFFDNGGGQALAVGVAGSDTAGVEAGLGVLVGIDFNLLCLPAARSESPGPAVVAAAAELCEKRRAFLIVDPDPCWDSVAAALAGRAALPGSPNAALYFPAAAEPQAVDRSRARALPLSAAVAGVYARTDGAVGVWKAPAGVDAALCGVDGLEQTLSEAEIGDLNRRAINPVRWLPGAGAVLWGARTLAGDDRSGSEWKYVPVRRLALFLEESIERGTQWTAHEPNGTALWGALRWSVGAFLQDLFQRGAFQGSTARDAFFVKVDAETTTQADIDAGRVNLVVGFAPLKPAEFVILRLELEAASG